MNADTDGLQALADEVAALSRKVSCLTGRLTVLGNALKHEGGLVPVTAAFQLGMEIGERAAVEGWPPAAVPKPARARHLSVVRQIGGQQ